MKKILIVDGGPRRAMNTAALCDAFAEGARAASPEIEVERVRLYDLPPYKGCVSCLACKLKGRETGLCAIRDGLTDALRAANDADGLAIASPIYFSEWTAMTRAFLERLVFPWLRYTDFSCSAPKKKPVARWRRRRSFRRFEASPAANRGVTASARFESVVAGELETENVK